MNSDSIPDAGVPRSQENNTKTIGRDYSFVELFKFAVSPIITQVAITLLQTIDDGLFLSRYVGENALASFSICFPIIVLMDAVASLFCGTNPFCSILMGEKRDKEARSTFTSVCFLCVIFGAIICLLISIDTEAVLRLLGATDLLIDDAMDFISINLYAFPFTILSTFFNRFYVVAGKPKYTVVTTCINAFCNFFFDWLFIVKMGVGIKGAAYADCIATAALVTFGIISYSRKDMEIGFSKPDFQVLKVLKNVLPYGIPQMFTSLTVSINSVISNNVLVNYGDEVCVSAYTIVNNIQFVFMAAYFGMSTAVCPMASFAYGEKNKDRLVRILKQIVMMVVVLSVLIILLYSFGDSIMVKMYLTEKSSEYLRTMVMAGLRLAPLGFLFFGFNVLAQDVFNAINDNSAASILAILENFIFADLFIILLPRFWGITGIWLAFPLAEFCSFFFVCYYAYRDRNRYGYGKSGEATFLTEE